MNFGLLKVIYKLSRSYTKLVGGHGGRSRLRKTWRNTIDHDCNNWKLTRVDPANRIESRKKLRTDMGVMRPTLSGTNMLNDNDYRYY